MARTAKASKAVVEVEDELEELDELVEEEAPPKKTRKAKAAAEDEKPKKRRVASADDEESSAYGVAWLAEYVNEQTGKEYTGANIRVLLRKLARNGDLDREIGVERGRYEFAGPNDPIVKAVLKAVKSGDVEKAKNERLADVKAKKAKKAAAEVEEVDDEDDDEDEEETPPPPKKKATRRR